MKNKKRRTKSKYSDTQQLKIIDRKLKELEQKEQASAKRRVRQEELSNGKYERKSADNEQFKTAQKADNVKKINLEQQDENLNASASRANIDVEKKLTAEAKKAAKAEKKKENNIDINQLDKKIKKIKKKPKTAQTVEEVKELKFLQKRGNKFLKRHKLIVVLLLVELIGLYFVFDFLPLKYKALIMAPTVLVIVANIIRIITKKVKKRAIISYILIVLNLILLPVGNSFGSTLNSVTQKTESFTYYVIARTDDPADTLDDLELGTTIGLQSSTSKIGNIYPKEDFTKMEKGFEYSEYNTYLDAAQALMVEDEDYIVIDTVENPGVLAYYPYFTENVKIIYEGTYKKVTEVVHKDISDTPFTLAICGTDARLEGIDTNTRCDSVMVLAIDPTIMNIQIISIPRDSYVESTCQGFSNDKVTHVGLDGMECYKETLENLLDVPIDYYAKVNFSSVIESVDALGGITVDVEADFCAQDENDVMSSVCFTQGEMLLDGRHALAYARERKSFGEGDVARARHQQQIIQAFVLETISDLSNINTLMNITANSARTDLTGKQITELALVAAERRDNTLDTYILEGTGNSVDIPFQGLYGTYVMDIDPTSLQTATDKLNAVLNGPSEETSEQPSDQ